MKHLMILLLAMIILLACSNNNVMDTTDIHSVLDSISKIENSLEGHKRSQFKESILLIMIDAKMNLKSDKVTGKFKYSVHGKTADEVIDLARFVRKKNNGVTAQQMGMMIKALPKAVDKFDAIMHLQKIMTISGDSYFINKIEKERKTLNANKPGGFEVFWKVENQKTKLNKEFTFELNCDDFQLESKKSSSGRYFESSPEITSSNNNDPDIIHIIKILNEDGSWKVFSDESDLLQYMKDKGYSLANKKESKDSFVYKFTLNNQGK